VDVAWICGLDGTPVVRHGGRLSLDQNLERTRFGELFSSRPSRRRGLVPAIVRFSLLCVQLMSFGTLIILVVHHAVLVNPAPS
jgi:hypothetical protein